MSVLTLGLGLVIVNTPSLLTAGLLRGQICSKKKHSFKPQHAVCNLQGCSDELQEAQTVLECLWTQLILLHAESTFATTPIMYLCPTRAAALLNVLKHTLHTWLLQPLGSSEPKPQTALPAQPAPPSPHTQLCSAGLHSSWRALPGSSRHWWRAENREQNGAILPENNVPQSCSARCIQQLLLILSHSPLS